MAKQYPASRKGYDVGTKKPEGGACATTANLDQNGANYRPARRQLRDAALMAEHNVASVGSAGSELMDHDRTRYARKASCGEEAPP